jgi:hypothetical protein
MRDNFCLHYRHSNDQCCKSTLREDRHPLITAIGRSLTLLRDIPIELALTNKSEPFSSDARSFSPLVMVLFF